MPKDKEKEKVQVLLRAATPEQMFNEIMDHIIIIAQKLDNIERRLKV